MKKGYDFPDSYVRTLIVFSLIGIHLMGCGGKNSSHTPPLVQPTADQRHENPSSVTDDELNRFQNGAGFFPIDDLRVPHTIKEAVPSVFHIVIIPRFTFGGVAFSRANIETYRKRVEEFSGDPNLKSVLSRQLDHCEKKYSWYQVWEYCDFQADLTSGTAFLAQNNTTIWTAIHVLDHAVGWREKLHNIEREGRDQMSQGLKFFLFDSKGQIVFDPYEDHSRVLRLGKIPENIFDRPEGPLDYVSLEVSKPLGTPLPVANRIPSLGDEVFTIGKPACTGSLCEATSLPLHVDSGDRSPFPNSDGLSFRVSRGFRLRPQLGQIAIAHSRFAERAKQILGRVFEGEQVVTSVDVMPGNSGGPLLDMNGHVVGVISGVIYGTYRGSRIWANSTCLPAWESE